MVFHDLAGWVMMPMALGMLFLLQQILAHLFVTEDEGVAVLAPRKAVPEVAGRGAVQLRNSVQPSPPRPVRPPPGPGSAARPD